MTEQALVRVLNNKQADRRPVWFMRQAGRYLPEYRKVREQAGSFLDLCYAPELAAEVTLQPLRRYDLDAAIIFADILVVPHAMGNGLSIVEGEGPMLESGWCRCQAATSMVVARRLRAEWKNWPDW